jgi:hypothetical protein|nr:MAG TPA: hypothetical protein [Caudoviricetes sp.]
MTEIEEITWDMFNERTRIWMQVLANIPAEAVVRMLRLDLNTGVATLHGVGGDRVLGVISTDDDTGVGRSFFVPLRSWSRDLSAGPIPYEAEYAPNIALAVYYSALDVLVGDVPLVWDEIDGLCWITDRIDEAFDDVNITDLRQYRDEVSKFAAECWVVDFAWNLEDDIPLLVTKESTPSTIRFLTGGHGSVEVVAAPDEEGLIDVNILDPKGRGLSFHLAYGTPQVQEAHDRAVLFLNNVIEKNKRKEANSGR